jgi:hypothetical protein
VEDTERISRYPGIDSSGLLKTVLSGLQTGSGVAVGVSVGRVVSVGVGVQVSVGVGVSVFVGVSVGVSVGVMVDVTVGVRVLVGVAVANNAPGLQAVSKNIRHIKYDMLRFIMSSMK